MKDSGLVHAAGVAVCTQAWPSWRKRLAEVINNFQMDPSTCNSLCDTQAQNEIQMMINI